MSAAELADRVERALARLDARLERQTFERGADAPHVVAIVGAYHRAAGDAERRAKLLRDVRGIAADVRVLRRIVATHRMLVRAAALRQPAAKDPTRHCFREESATDACDACGHPADAHTGCDCDDAAET